MQAGQKLGIVYIGKAGGKVSAELFWSGSSTCKSYIFCPASEVEVVLENCWCYFNSSFNLWYVKTKYNLRASFSAMCKPEFKISLSIDIRIKPFCLKIEEWFDMICTLYVGNAWYVVDKWSEEIYFTSVEVAIYTVDNWSYSALTIDCYLLNCIS